jgi:centromere/kinetochore protein ZW10
MDVWTSLVHCDTENNVVTVEKSKTDEPTTLEQAVLGLKAYKELDNVAKLFSESLDSIILRPRTNLIVGSIPNIETTSVSQPKL